MRDAVKQENKSLKKDIDKFLANGGMVEIVPNDIDRIKRAANSRAIDAYMPLNSRETYYAKCPVHLQIKRETVAKQDVNVGNRKQ